MEFKNLLPFILVLIYVLSLFGKKKKKQAQNVQEDQSGLKSIIQKVARQIKAHAEELQREAERQKREKLKEMVAEDRRPPAAKPAASSAREEELELDLEEDAIEAIQPRAAARAPQQEPAAALLPKRAGGRRTGRLARAVVWSEILGPPVALRDNHRDLF